jgi:hypothetical protein
VDASGVVSRSDVGGADLDLRFLPPTSGGFAKRSLVLCNICLSSSWKTKDGMK